MTFIVCTLLLLLAQLSLGANYYVSNPSNCPTSDGTNFPGQNCFPQNICGAVGTTAQCYTTSTLSAPAGSSSTTGSGGTDYSCSDVTCSGGFVTDCYAVADSASPFCDNNGAFLIDRNATCYNKHVQTTATGGSFVLSSCSVTCTTNYFQCDGSTTDADGCEIQAGSSCGAGTGTVVLNQCFSASAGNCTSASRLDCNNDDSDSNIVTCNGADGCEILNGGSCTIGGLVGVYSGCNGAVGNCVVNPSNFVTGTQANYSTSLIQNFLWGWDYGLGNLLFLRNNATNSNFSINKFGCIVFNDSTTQCTASTGSSSGGGGGGISTITSTDKYAIIQNATTTNVSINETQLNNTIKSIYNSTNPNLFINIQNVTKYIGNGSNMNMTNITTKNINVSGYARFNFTCYWEDATGCISYIYSNGTDLIIK